jgi:hypothetical protein
MDVTGIRKLALLQQRRAIWRYCSGLGLMAAPGTATPVLLLLVVVT